MVISPALSGGVTQYFGAELEVHGVVMVPGTSPDETMAFENIHKLRRDTIMVGDAVGFGGTRILP